MEKKNKLIITILIIFILLVSGFILYNTVLYKQFKNPIILKEDNIILIKGDVKILNYESVYEDKIEWISTDNSIVSVYNGLLKANGVGEATIIVKGSNNKQLTIKVTVLNKIISNIELNDEIITLSVGEKKELSYKIEPIDAVNDLIWESSNNDVIKVNNNTIEALKIGESIITVRSNNIKKEVKVIVDTININNIIFDKTNIDLYLNEKLKLNYTIDPINSTNSNLVWNSSNNEVVSVEDGVITGIKSGSSIITATSFNGVNSSINVNVINKEILEINNSNKYLFGKSNNIIVSSNKEIDNLFVVELYKNNNLINKKELKEKNYTITLNEIGYYTIKAYLLDKNNNKTEISKNYSYTSLSNIQESLNSLNKNYTFKNTNTTYLAFGSDYQKKEVRKSNLSGILNKLNSLNIKPNLMMYLGDYQPDSGSSGTTSGIKEINNMIHNLSNLNETPVLYLQGNHDPENHELLVKSGGYDSYNFSLFAINREDHHGKESGDKAIANKLDKYLNDLILSKSHKPVFILTHVPLHYSSRKDNKYSNYIIDVLNKYGDALDIIFMFGHNENPGGYDDCFGGSMNYLAKGSTMKYYQGSSTKTGIIKFTYMNGGYVGYAGKSAFTETCNGTKVTVPVTLTMSLHTITNNEIKIQRVSNNNIIDVVTIKRNLG